MVQSSKNCWDQTTTCYKSAGPTGSKNCHNWEDYCTELGKGCASGSYNGPPSISSFMPAPLKKLDMSKVVVDTGSKQPSSPAPADSSASAVTGPYVSATASTASASDTATAETDQSMANGSIDTCGSNGGQNCKTGMCCSALG